MSQQSIQDYCLLINKFAQGDTIDSACVESPLQSFPQRLLIFYGIPQLINGSTTIEEAAKVFEEYDIVVFGAGLESVESEWHQDFVTLANSLTRPVLFGYTDIQGSVSIEAIKSSIDGWKAIESMQGVLLDNFGTDFRGDMTYEAYQSRQVELVEYMRIHSMGFILNAFDPIDVFSPQSANIALTSDKEFYLFESFGVKNDMVIEDGMDMAIMGQKITFLDN